MEQATAEAEANVAHIRAILTPANTTANATAPATGSAAAQATPAPVANSTTSAN